METRNLSYVKLYPLKTYAMKLKKRIQLCFYSYKTEFKKKKKRQ